MNATTAYRSAIALALAAALLLAWMIPALGVIGVEGDPFDRLYLAVFAVGIVGVFIARLRPLGMSRVLLAMALATALVTIIALIAGKHQSPVTSIPELVGLNAMFITLFIGSALLFHQAARRQQTAHLTK